MARTRGMSTKTGLPTGATYVFVNMLRKLREEFSPEYSGGCVRCLARPLSATSRPAPITKVRKFDLKTQTFQEVDYGGYKANRSEMPADLVQQVPYVAALSRPTESRFSSTKGYEADDLIGTLAPQGGRNEFLHRVRRFQ